jgi:hypothetical protein
VQSKTDKNNSFYVWFVLAIDDSANCCWISSNCVSKSFCFSTDLYFVLLLSFNEANNFSIDYVTSTDEKKATDLYNYYEKEYRHDPFASVVLVKSKNLKELKKAYPNYFLDTQYFVKTIEDALNMYLDTDAKNIKHWTTSPVCTINKTHGARKVYKATDNLTFQDVIDSTYHPITINELVNPANKDNDKYQCVSTGVLNIYRDEDYVYYYKIAKSSFECLNSTGDITNLPNGCNG